MFSNIKAAIFDMDGTLIDSMWVWEAIDREYMARYDLEYTIELRNHIEGMNFFDTANYFRENLGIQETVEKIMADWHEMAYDKYVNEIPFKPGIVELLENLRKNNIKIGIATSNSRELVDAFLESKNAKHLFDYIATSTEVKASKPAPDLYLAVAKNLGVKPENCLVFEDVPQGIMAGKNANMKTCAVYDEYSLRVDSQKRELADYYIDDYTGISVKDFGEVI